MGLDQFNLSAFWQIIGLKRRSRESGHPDQIVGCQRKDELERDATNTLCLVLCSPAIVLVQAKLSSIRLRMIWLTA
jgi:hypothetical protein